MENDFYTLTIFADYNDKKPEIVPKANGFAFGVPKGMPSDFFFSEKGSLNVVGGELVTKLLVESLSANIHSMHQSGVKDSAKHLREAIGLLEQLFISQCEVKTYTQENIKVNKTK